MARPRKSKPPPVPAARADRLHVDRQWRWHYRRLIELRDHLIQSRSGARAASPLDFTLGLLGTETDALAELNAAIERVLRGSYGACELTGLPIPARRLRAAPWTRALAQFQQLNPRLERLP